MFLWIRTRRTHLPRLNTDVLCSILAELNPQDLSSAARVSREWLYIAQSKLYHRVAVRLHYSSLSRSQLLARTLTNSGHLRAFVRHLIFEYFDIGGGWDKLLFGWVSLLPEHGILSVRLSGRYVDTSDALRDLPAIRTARHIILEPSLSLSQGRLAKILCLSHLQGLSIAGCCTNPLILPDAKLNLQRTPFSTSPQLVPSHIPTIVEYLPSTTQLTRFDVEIPSLHPHEASHLVSALKRHAPSLVRITLFSRGLLTSGPFMDEFAPLLVSARYICCAYGTYTVSGLLPRLPPALCTLVLAWGTDGANQVLDPNGYGFILAPTPDNRPFPSEELAVEILRLRTASLRRLLIVLPDFIRDQCQPVAKACASSGITFKRLSMSDALTECIIG